MPNNSSKGVKIAAIVPIIVFVGVSVGFGLFANNILAISFEEKESFNRFDRLEPTITTLNRELVLLPFRLSEILGSSHI